MEKAEGVKADGLVKNGLPRVAWTGESRGVKYRLVLEEDCGVESASPRFVRSGEQLVLEKAVGADAMGVERWDAVDFGARDDGPIWALAKFAMQFDGPHCMSCCDSGRFDEGCANGDTLTPPCTACERGRQVAEASR